MEWQPIETAPKDGSEVLVFRNYPDGAAYAVAFFNGKEWRDVGDIGWAGMYGDDDNQPTHWMPLPAAPAGAYPAISGDSPLDGRVMQHTTEVIANE